MKKATRIGILLSLFITYSSSSFAALLLEPVLGYNVTSTFQTEENDDLDNNVSLGGHGVAYGGRIGYQMLGFQLGVDYLRSSISLNDDDYNENLSLSEWAGFVGFEFPVFFRIYAGYIFAANGSTSADDPSKTKEYSSGSGAKVGIGFTGLPFVDINLEYRKGKFDEYTDDDKDTGAITNYSAWMLGISVPLNI